MYLSWTITTHLVSGLERFHYIKKKQALFSACKHGASHGASQKDIYGCHGRCTKSGWGSQKHTFPNN